LSENSIKEAGIWRGKGKRNDERHVGNDVPVWDRQGKKNNKEKLRTWTVVKGRNGMENEVARAGGSSWTCEVVLDRRQAFVVPVQKPPGGRCRCFV